MVSPNHAELVNSRVAGIWDGPSRVFPRYGKWPNVHHVRLLMLEPPVGLLKQRKLTMAIDDKTQTELEAAVFRRLVEHLRARTDVQNIDLMNLAGFCRNCLSNWLKDAADEKGVALSKDESREAVYGMPYETWKTTYQTEATPDQQAAMKKNHAGH